MENKNFKLIIWVRKNKALIYFGGMLLFLSPIFLFTRKFGFGISDRIEAWKNTAEIFNNFYTPILSFIAAIIVLITFKNQYDINRISSASSKYKFFSDIVQMNIDNFTEELKKFGVYQFGKEIRSGLIFEKNDVDLMQVIFSIKFINDEILKYHNTKNTFKPEFKDPISIKLFESKLNEYLKQFEVCVNYFNNLKPTLEKHSHDLDSYDKLMEKMKIFETLFFEELRILDKSSQP